MFAFDTLLYVERLKSAGISGEQAKIHAEELRAILDENIVSKRDLNDLDAKIDARLAEVKRDIKELDVSVKRDIEMVRKDVEMVRKEFKADLETTKTDLIKWMVALLLAQLGLLMTFGRFIFHG